MNKLIIKILLFIGFFVACISGKSSVTRQRASLEFKEFSEHSFNKPISFIYNQKKFALVVEKGGKIWQITTKDNQKKLLLDISKRLANGTEQGLLDATLTPKKLNQELQIYVSYVDKKQILNISRFSFEYNKSVDLSTEQVLLSIKQPYSNHNGGELEFGPDGYLYIGVGDGGSRGDPQNNAQNLSNLLGKILRIDVSDPINTYRIPRENLFGYFNYRSEIYAYGLRNPWTFSFDEKTGNLYTADVGQRKQEEVNLVLNGGNYGWRIWEGNERYNSRDSLKFRHFIFPVDTYDRAWGSSIIGGYVYRGSIKELQGFYLYADFNSGNFTGIKLKNNKIEKKFLFNPIKLRISRFAQDYKKELYICSFTTGKIYRLEKLRKREKLLL